ncbi:MAG: FkbM family methyltransferase [Sediminibacterium sp.]|nr:FkbM family methyltransferase [Sediminibacterium sp.]
MLKQKEITRFYKRFVKKGDLCFDIGANSGERTDCLLKAGAKVITVEPQGSCYAILQKKYKGTVAVTLLKCAVGSKEREDELFICDETSECSTLSKAFIATYTNVSQLNWRQTERVRVTTLENMCLQYGTPEFCKVDVEGYESEVFAGLKRPIRFICFEFNRPLLNDTLKSLELLNTLGNYQCNYLKYETMSLVLPDWLPLNVFAEQIELLIPQEVLTGEIVLECLSL